MIQQAGRYTPVMFLVKAEGLRIRRKKVGKSRKRDAEHIE
jgi:hypothetical protein